MEPSTDTQPESQERLKWVLTQLGLNNYEEDIVKRVPELQPPTIIEDREDSFIDWYTPERQQENTYYWDDYVRVLTRNGWDAESIATVSNQATEVLRHMEDPREEHKLSSRGLVVGYVQSGKTANFTAVAAKAIDAGYRFIIILAGTMDILREQTQRRLDKELCGKEAVLSGRVEGEIPPRDRKDETYFDNDEEWDRSWDKKGGAFIDHGSACGQCGFPKIKRITTSKLDFKHSPTNPIEIHSPDQSKPLHHPNNLNQIPCLVAVVKKNSTVLKNLNSALSRAARESGNLNDLPILVIDDESDQASINTKRQPKRSKEEKDQEIERTAVNREIVQLLKICKRAQYVGYTATPYANVFINPDDMEDLYPRHYVLMLNEPPKYRGAKWFHDRMEFIDDPEEATITTSNSKAFVRDLVEQSSYTDEDNDDFARERKRELTEALDMFMLTGAIKKYREDKVKNLSFKHHTMLVHEAVGNDIHSDGKQLLSDIWKERAYNLGASLPQLKKLFEEDLLPVMQIKSYNDDLPIPQSFDELKPYISTAYSEIMKGVTTNNSPILQVDSEGKENPNFEQGPVWKVLVGGAKLSRGYTIEGLTISYFRRTPGSADTLMQTGRWFGFRKGYQDLVRLYAPPTLVSMFESAMNDEEAFREQLKVYAEDNNRLTPVMLPPLVRQSHPTLSPTSVSKMSNAELVAVAPAPEVASLWQIPNRDNPALKENFANVGIPLLKTLSSTPVSMTHLRDTHADHLQVVHSEYYVGTMPSDKFVSILEKMKWRSDVAKTKATRYILYLKNLIGRGKHASVENSDFSEIAVLLPKINKVKGSLQIEGAPFDVPLLDRSRNQESGLLISRLGNSKNRYIIENVASGRSVLDLRTEDKMRLIENGVELPLPDPKQAEPFDLDSPKARTRGAVMLILFDDRDPDFVKRITDEDRYTPPSWENNEVGLMLGLNSPHAALGNSGRATLWSTRLPD